MNKIRVAVGLSGGVDSAVSAYLLKKQDFDVSGVYLHCFDDDAPGCRGKQDRQDAVKVALHLKIPFQVLDLRKEYKAAVIGYFKKEYLAGRTPNPDVVCNRDIKFGLLLDWCIKNGFDYLATGHYADVAEILPEQNFAATPAPAEKRATSRERIVHEVGEWQAKAGATILRIPKDKHKDQTYFLWAVPRQNFSRVLFPLADFRKQDVRSVAKFAKIPVAAKPDSTGICFIGEVRVEDFLKRLGVKEKKGEVVMRVTELRLDSRNLKIDEEVGRLKVEREDSGLSIFNFPTSNSSFQRPASNFKYEVIGSHRGVAFYTIGQRHGFEITKWPVIGSNLSLHKANSNILKNLRISFNRSTDQPTNSKQTTDNRKPITDRPPLYVIAKDVRLNRLIVGFGAECYRDQFEVGDLNWLAPEVASLLPSTTLTVGTRRKSATSGLLVRIRHLGDLIPCSVIGSPFSVFGSLPAGRQGKSAGLKPTNRKLTNRKPKTDNRELITVFLSIPQRGVASGQSAVFYLKDGLVLGGGVIQ